MARPKKEKMKVFAVLINEASIAEKAGQLQMKIEDKKDIDERLAILSTYSAISGRSGEPS